MNKKFHIFFFVLSALLFYLQAEQTEYFINPNNFYAPFIAVGRSADIHKYEYSCYIRNDFHNKVDEPETQLCTTWERFFSSLEEYWKAKTENSIRSTGNISWSLNTRWLSKNESERY